MTAAVVLLTLSLLGPLADRDDTPARELAKTLGWGLSEDGTHLIIDSPETDDKKLAFLKRFSKLSALTLASTRTTDAAMKEVAGLKGLRSLYLLDGDISDVGLGELKAMKNLKVLSITHSSKVSGKGRASAYRRSLQVMSYASWLLLHPG